MSLCSRLQSAGVADEVPRAQVLLSSLEVLLELGHSVRPEQALALAARCLAEPGFDASAQRMGRMLSDMQLLQRPGASSAHSQEPMLAAEVLAAQVRDWC